MTLDEAVVYGLGETKVKYAFYPKADHDSWTKAHANAKLSNWLLQHTRL